MNNCADKFYPKTFEISPHPLPLPSGERGRVRGNKLGLVSDFEIRISNFFTYYIRKDEKCLCSHLATPVWIAASLTFLATISGTFRFKTLGMI